MYQNTFLGKVSDNNDSDKLHRIKVRFMYREEAVSDWMPYITSYSGAEIGLSMLPNIDEEVLVLSLDQQNSRFVAVGTIWNEVSAPPETGENSEADFNQDGNNSLHFIKSKAENMLIFDDTDGSEKMQLITAESASRFEFLTEEELVSLITEQDISLSAKGILSFTAEEIEITAEKQVNFSGEEVQASATKVFEVTADKDITIKGSGIALN